MNVQRVRTETGSHIEPALDERWDDLTKLQWQAAVVWVDSQADARVERSRSWRNGIRQWHHYDVKVDGTSSGPLPFDTAWAFLSGVSVGARAARDEAHW